MLLRGLLALLLLLIVILLVWFDRAYYTDSYDGEVSLLDAFYYATMTLTTTGTATSRQLRRMPGS